MITLRNETGESRLTLRKLARFLQRHVVQTFLALRFTVRNLTSRSEITNKAGQTVVSLTTYGPRIRTAHLAVESISNGTLLPRRTLLWVDSDSLHIAQSFPPLKRLVRRGLEILPTDASLRSHKKYYPYVQSDSARTLPLVTADDDIFYPRDWLATLWSEFVAEGASAVISSWVKEPRFDDDHFAPYITWTSRRGTAMHRKNYLMSGSGTIYPIGLAAAISAAGDEFRTLTPTADDIWLNYQAFKADVPIRQAKENPIQLWSVPRSQSVKLSHENVIQSLNDVQLSKTYSAAEVRRLIAEPQ